MPDGAENAALLPDQPPPELPTHAAAEAEPEAHGRAMGGMMFVF